MEDANNYLKRVLPQHKKPKFLNWLKSNIEILNDAEMVLMGINDAFDIDNAQGNQLDILGEIVGRSRLLDFQPLDGSPPTLTDETYRLMIKAKIGINHWDGTINNIYELWQNLFPEYEIYIRDNQDMTMDVYIKGPSPLPLKELIARNYIVPKPMTVGVKYTFLQEFEAVFDLYIAQAVTTGAEYVISNAVTKEHDINDNLYVAQAVTTGAEYEISNAVIKEFTLTQEPVLGELLLIEKYYRF